MPLPLTTNREDAPLLNARPSAQTTVAEANEADIDALASLIGRAGLGSTAVILLQTFKPLAWVGGQVLWTLQPLAEGITGRRSVDSTASTGSGFIAGLARVLEREGGVDALVSRISKGRKSP